MGDVSAHRLGRISRRHRCKTRRFEARFRRHGNLDGLVEVPGGRGILRSFLLSFLARDMERIRGRIRALGALAWTPRLACVLGKDEDVSVDERRRGSFERTRLGRGRPTR